MSFAFSPPTPGRRRLSVPAAHLGDAALGGLVHRPCRPGARQRSRACFISPLLPLDLLFGGAGCSSLAVLLLGRARPLRSRCSCRRTTRISPEVEFERSGPCGREVTRSWLTTSRQSPTSSPEHVVKLAAGVEVEVVGRFVQEQYVGAACISWVARPREMTWPPLRACSRWLGQRDVAESQAVELGREAAFLDVPVVPDRREVVLRSRPRTPDGVQRLDDRGDAEHLGHREIATVRGRLWGR